MREDILMGLKNAIERGEPIEKAVQSFINAGYNPIEVKQAAESLVGGATAIISHYIEQDGRSLPPPPVKAAAPRESFPAQTQIRQQNALSGQTNVQLPPQMSEAPVVYKKLNEIQPMQGMMQIRAPRRKSIGLIVFLIIVLLLLIGGLIYLILYGQEFLNSLLGA